MERQPRTVHPLWPVCLLIGAMGLLSMWGCAGGFQGSRPVAPSMTQPATPAAKSLVPSTATPPYRASVNLVPTFSGGTAMIGSMGVGSSDITASAVNGASYQTPAL